MYSYIFYSVIVICLTIIFCLSLKFYLNYKTNNKIKHLISLIEIAEYVINNQHNQITKLRSEITALETDLVKFKSKIKKGKADVLNNNPNGSNAIKDSK